VFEAPEGVAIDDPVPVELKGGSHLARLFRDPSPSGPGAGAGKRRHERSFALFEFLTDGNGHRRSALFDAFEKPGFSEIA